MRKKFLHESYGSAHEFWERNWKNAIPPGPQVHAKLVRLMARYLRHDMHLLEGGCGNGNYLRYFHDLGFRVTGVDFAEETVLELKRRFPELDIRKGDITALDFADETFDSYYSGGVIEHFQEGPYSALAEAHRVLRNGGFLFVTVPHENWIRQISNRLVDQTVSRDLNGRLAMEKKMPTGFIVEGNIGEFRFHEHFFTTREMRQFLRGAGFGIVEEACISTAWGLRDWRAFRTAAALDRQDRSLLNKIVGKAFDLTDWIDSQDWAPVTALSSLQSNLFGNLKLYICRAEKSR